MAGERSHQSVDPIHDISQGNKSRQHGGTEADYSTGADDRGIKEDIGVGGPIRSGPSAHIDSENTHCDHGKSQIADCQRNPGQRSPDRHPPLFIKEQPVQKGHDRHDIMQDDQVPDDMTVLDHGVKYHEMTDQHCDQKRYSRSVFEGGGKNIPAFTFFRSMLFAFTFLAGMLFVLAVFRSMLFSFTI